MESEEKIIKSRERVQETGEVFTRKREVGNMLRLVHAGPSLFATILEPACGNGNFLVEILKERLNFLMKDQNEWHPENREWNILKITSTIYGIDIAPDNIAECKYRMKQIVFDTLPDPSSSFLKNFDIILSTNIQVGDMLDGRDHILFTQWKTPSKNRFRRNIFSLTDMENGNPKPIETLPIMEIKNV